MATADRFARLVELRRDLHRHPEPAWQEVYTTARIVEELERIGVDELHVGAAALDRASRWGLPDDPAVFEAAVDRARGYGIRDDLLEALDDGLTGIVATLDRGDGPHVGLRVDIDGLSRMESTDPDHVPAAEGFRSEHDGVMHACGHDGHATIGVGVLEAIAGSDFAGRLTVCFQPAEEEIGGGKAMTERGHLDDVEYFLAIHLGLGQPTGTIVGGYDGFLAVSNLEARFAGDGAHAGAKPEAGRNAVQALATAIQNLYSIPRHSDGSTRVNVGRIEGGSATNIIPEDALLEGEVRGGTTALRDYMKDRARRTITAAAEMHHCEAEVVFGPEAPSGTSDDALAAVVADVARDVDGVDTVREHDRFRGSEDATFMMERVQERGGLATYVGIGTDHPGGHHTATFDIDETSLRIGVEVLTDAIRSLERDHPIRSQA